MGVVALEGGEEGGVERGGGGGGESGGWVEVLDCGLQFLQYNMACVSMYDCLGMILGLWGMSYCFEFVVLYVCVRGCERKN